VQGGNLTIVSILVVSLLAVLSAKRKAKLEQGIWSKPVLLLAALLAGAVCLALRAGPFSMYYASVAALTVLLAARAFAMARRSAPRIALVALLAVSLMPALPRLKEYAKDTVSALDMNKWTGVQAHRSAMRVAQAIERHGAAGHVATLFPILVLDANPVLRQFSAGPFFFRNARIYSLEEVERRPGVGPATMERLFAEDPPAAIVGGFGPFQFKWDPAMDAELMDYAKRAGYVQVERDWKVKGYPRGEVWIRPRAGMGHASDSGSRGADPPASLCNVPDDPCAVRRSVSHTAAPGRLAASRQTP
jgi:hypothetical protein